MRKHLSQLTCPYFLLCIVFTSGFTDEIGFFWQLTDIHLDLDYLNHSCKGTYGDAKCDSPVELVQLAVNETKRLLATRRSDFVIWSGDNGPHVKELSERRLLDHIKTVSRALRAVFPPDVYILPTVGNHDVSPANQMSPDLSDTQRLSWCHTLATDPELWAHWIKPFDPAAPTKDRPLLSQDHSNDTVLSVNNPPWANFSTGCFHSHLLPERKLLLVSLNGLIWYTGNSLAGNAGPDPLGQLRWLNSTFAWARQTEHKVLVVCHFPPGASENAPHRFEFLRPEINDLFVRLLQQNADVIMAGLFGHEHVDTFRVLRDQEEDRPAVSLLLAPSISPLRMSGLGSFNPRIRLYRYQRATGLLLGFAQYFLNLSRTESPRWVLEYDTNSTYELRDLSPTSLARLLDQFEQDETPDGPWSRYWQHELGGRPHEPRSDLTPDGRCPRAASTCRCEHLCAMRNLRLSPLHECLRGCPSITTAHARDTRLIPELKRVRANLSDINGTSGGSGAKPGSSLPIIVGVIIAFLAILVGVVLLVNREICRKRSRYSNSFAGPSNSVGGVIFSTLNDTFPRSFGGTGNTAARSNGFGDSGKLTPQCDSTAGSCTELRVAFQPHYALEDELSVITQGTIDYHSHGLVRPSISAARRASQLLPTRLAHPIKSTRRANGHLLSVSPVGVSSIQLPSSSPDNRYSVPEFGRHLIPSDSVADHDRPSGSAVQLGEHSSILGGDSSVGALPSTVSNLSCRAEDYYADDEEAFGDDEDEGEESERLGESSSALNHHPPVVETNDEPTSSTDSGPFDDGGQPFNLNSDKPMKPNKSIKDWNFITKRRSKRGCGVPLRRRQSLEDPLSTTPVRRSDYTPVVHSQSITADLGVLPQTTYNNIQANHTEIVHSLPSVDVEDPSHLPSQINGNPIEQQPSGSRMNGLPNRELRSDGAAHQTLGYDYVRM